MMRHRCLHDDGLRGRRRRLFEHFECDANVLAGQVSRDDVVEDDVAVVLLHDDDAVTRE